MPERNHTRYRYFKSTGGSNHSPLIWTIDTEKCTLFTPSGHWFYLTEVTPEELQQFKREGHTPEIIGDLFIKREFDFWKRCGGTHVIEISREEALAHIL